MLTKTFEQTQDSVTIKANYNKLIPTNYDHLGAYEYVIELKALFIRDQFYDIVHGLSNGALVYQRDIDLSRIDTGHTAIISQSALDTWLMSVKKIVETKPQQYSQAELQQFKIVYDQATVMSRVVQAQHKYLHHKKDVNQIFWDAAKVFVAFAYSILIWIFGVNFTFLNANIFDPFKDQVELIAMALTFVGLVGIAMDVLKVIPYICKSLYQWIYVDDDRLKAMLVRYADWKYARKVPKSFSLEDGHIKTNAAKKE